jgi:hypothetical protein
MDPKKPRWTMTVTEQAIQIARSKLGMHEVGGPNQGPIVEWAMRPWSKSALGSWAEWCCAFVCSCLLEAGSQTIRKVASTNCNALWKNCNKAGYAWVRFKTPTAQPPQPGDVVFYGTDTNIYHVGLVTTIDPLQGIMTTIEGNDDNAVREEKHPLTHRGIFGFARIG